MKVFGLPSFAVVLFAAGIAAPSAWANPEPFGKRVPAATEIPPKQEVYGALEEGTPPVSSEKALKPERIVTDQITHGTPEAKLMRK